MRSRSVLWLIALLASFACGDSSRDQTSAPARASGNSPRDTAPAAPALDAWLDSTRRSEERDLYMEAARAAWRFANRNYVAATGLTRPFDTYAVSTMWDIASGLAAMYCARELGLLEAAEYEQRMRTALGTLKQLPLFDDVSFNKEYQTDTARMLGLTREPSERGYGLSATDTGRLLTWLRIIAVHHPQFAADAEAIVRRIDFDEIIDDGYLNGRQLSRATRRVRSFQEGRIGYEQYAASGFALWDRKADKALDIGENAKEVRVSDVPLPGDRRGNDRLTSEPFILLGLEVGWTPEQRGVAERLLAAQQARYRSSGHLTMVSEDAINIAPDYFFYYTAYSKNGPWSIDVQRPRVKVDGPRWVSTKATFAWHAIVPGDYTRMVFDTVRARGLAAGVWGSGVFENGRPTGNPNINTAAVVLEAALYRMRGAPLVRPARTAPDAGAPAAASVVQTTAARAASDRGI